MSKRVGFCGNLTRIILGLFSLLFLLIGIALVTLTSLIKWSNVFSSIINTSSLSTELKLVSLDSITIVLLCIGAFTIVLSLIGLIAVITLNKCLLVFFEIVCVLIFLAHAGAFIAYFIYEPKLKTELEKAFNQTIAKNSTANQVFMLSISNSLKCCGSTGLSDFNNTSSQLYCTNTVTNSTVGCSSAVYDLIKKYSLYGIIIPTSILLFIELVIIVSTPILIFRVNRSSD